MRQGETQPGRNGFVSPTNDTTSGGGETSGRERRKAAGGVRQVVVRTPHLYRSVRLFCLGAFAQLNAEQERGAQLQFALEEHVTQGRPALYEHRPLVHSFVEERADRLEQHVDARIALEELRREPAAAIFGRGEHALFRAILLP